MNVSTYVKTREGTRQYNSKGGTERKISHDKKTGSRRLIQLQHCTAVVRVHVLISFTHSVSLIFSTSECCFECFLPVHKVHDIYTPPNKCTAPPQTHLPTYKTLPPHKHIHHPHPAHNSPETTLETAVAVFPVGEHCALLMVVGGRAVGR